MFSCTSDQEIIQNELSISFEVSPPESGTVLTSDSGPFIKGAVVALTAVPYQNFKFSHWEGDISGEEDTQSIIVDANKSFIAVFRPLDTFATEHVVAYDASLIDSSGYVFMMENGQNAAYLVNHEGDKLKEWSFDNRLGNDLEITPSGSLLGSFKVNEPFFSFGGFGGHIKKLSANGSVIWEYVVNTENEIAHHDATEMPNGNILIMIWERISEEQLSDVGLAPGHDIFTEKLIEVNPETDEIVWQWRSWEHIVQELDVSKDLYGLVHEHPNKINIAYNDLENGDWMHANGIFYDSSKDLIYMSVNFYSEVWVIDHSTNIQESATDQGGQYNRGGDLIYRFGNPAAFGGDASSRFLFNNHHPSLVQDTYPGAGNLLIFNNGSNNEQSIAYELSLPSFSQNMMQTYESPQSVWSYSHPDLYFPRISGMVRLPNGNTLICEGDYGYWEVTAQGQIAWKYSGLGKSFWRGYFYSKNDPRLRSFNLEN
ncbi:MAG: aryl-sulfate sulfotransferase [Flavobacteriia bacterium]|nr:aryl-sulfate sulfotransferase [Flavobacteriia bacterium]